MSVKFRDEINSKLFLIYYMQVGHLLNFVIQFGNSMLLRYAVWFSCQRSDKHKTSSYNFSTLSHRQVMRKTRIINSRVLS